MLPGFTAIPTSSSVENLRLNPQGVLPAGIWDDPDPEDCTQPCIPIRTETSCIIVTLWCTDIFMCCGRREESRFPYPCGVCVGLDW